MTHSLYTSLKGVAYATLATFASCDHNKAKAAGYTDGWQMLLDRHDGPEMAAFCGALPKVLSEDQARVLLDGLAQEYTQFKRWPDFVEACAEHPEWLPSKGLVG